MYARYPPVMLTHEEVLTLLQASGEGPLACYNRAVLVIMYRSGMRVSETLALYAKDLDPILRLGTHVTGKHGRSRAAEMDAGAFKLVCTWMKKSDAELLRCSALLSIVCPQAECVARCCGKDHYPPPPGQWYCHISRFRAEAMDNLDRLHAD